MPLSLSAILNGERRLWPLSEEAVLVGRSSKNSVHIPDATVSKDHAEIIKHVNREQLAAMCDPAASLGQSGLMVDRVLARWG